MSDGKPIKISAVTASEVCAHFNLEKSARQPLDDRMGPGEFVEALVVSKQYLAGIEFMAHALPAREAIWWGCLCLQYACGNELSTSEKAACKAAVRWVLQPIEGNRAAAKAPAEAAGPASPNLPPRPFAPARAVANAVKCASLKGDPVRRADRQRLFVELGTGVAEGRFIVGLSR